jgi:glycerol-3-phosphate acyltransferase PlsX
MTEKKFTVAVDGMGGDYAPEAVVDGVKQAAEAHPDTRFIVTGPAMVGQALAGVTGVEYVEAPDVIDMAEEPGRAVRNKPDSSLVTAARLVKEGRADAFVSAGNTGAAMAAALLVCGRVEGVKRPAIAVILPSGKDDFVLVDAGANADCKPEYLPQFAVMGSVYAEHVLGKHKPRVALLNNGEEAEKGSSFTKEAHKLIGQAQVNFTGNIEGREMFEDGADVVVTDGFTGNVVLKVVEGVAMMLLGAVKEGMSATARGIAGGALIRPVLRGIVKRNDPEATGGAALLGINGVVIIAHGRSNATAIKNACGVARSAVSTGIVEKIKQGIA